MRIAISGTHCIGKSTLIKDFIKKHPDYKEVSEPYDKLQDELSVELSLEPSLENLLEQLDYSLIQINEHASESNVIFDRCPVDFIAYAMCAIEEDCININESIVAERFSEIKEALNNLDLIVFLPLTGKYTIEYIEENPAYRESADECFKKIYRDDICDVFPGYNRPKIIEVWGNRSARLRTLESYII